MTIRLSKLNFFLGLHFAFQSTAIFAQLETTMPPQRPKVDRNGVDIQSGAVVLDEPGIEIGTGSVGAISYRRNYLRGWRSNFSNSRQHQQDATLNSQSDTMVYGNFGKYESYTALGQVSEDLYDGISFSALKDGTKLTFGKSYLTASSGSYQQYVKLLTKVSHPNGITETYNYQDSGVEGVGSTRLSSITTNAGYIVKFEYESNTPPTEDNTSSSWDNVSSVTIINGSIEYCAPDANACNLTSDWPSVSFSASGTLSVMDNSFSKKMYGYVNEEVSGVNTATFSIYDADQSLQKLYTLKAISSPCIEYNCPGSELSLKVVSAIIDGEETKYRYEDDDGELLVTVERPEGTEYYISGEDGDGITKINALGLSHIFTEDHGNVVNIDNPDGDTWNFEYDTRGNRLSEVHIGKDGEEEINITRTYPSSCDSQNSFICNKPTSTIDANGNETDYVWNTSNGGLTSKMGPAPSSGAARPLTLNTWTQRYAWILNSSGTLVQETTPIWVISTETRCQTVAGSNTAACDSSAPSIVTTYEYGDEGTAEALLVKGIAVQADGEVHRTCYTYDRFNRQVSVTKPRSDLTSCS